MSKHRIDKVVIEVDKEAGKFFRYPPNALEEYDIILGIAPTGSGKTTSTLRLVAPYVKKGMDPSARILKLNPQVIFALPTKAACFDVANTAAQMYGSRSVIIDNSDTKAILGGSVKWTAPIVVTTYEKLAIVLSHKPDIVKDKVVVFDEFHMITDPDRAVNIDIAVATIMKHKAELGWRTKIIGLSATFPETDKVAEYFARFSDVLVIEGKEKEARIVVEYGQPKAVFLFRRVPFWMKVAAKIDAAVEWLKKLESKGINPYPALIYIPNKSIIARMHQYLTSRYFKEDEVVAHHADLEPEERNKILMELKKPDTKIKVVLATDTLAMSVNTAVKSVIMPMLTSRGAQGVYRPSPTRIRQIIGRAGRPGISKDNTAYVLVFPDNSEERERVEKALKGEYEGIAFPNDGFKLFLYVTKLGYSYKDYAEYSLLAYPDKVEKLEEMLQSAKDEAERAGLVMEREGKLVLSPLGASMAGMLFSYKEFVASLGAAVSFFHEKSIKGSLLEQRPEKELWKAAVRAVLPAAFSVHSSCFKSAKWLETLAASNPDKYAEVLSKARDSALVSVIKAPESARCLDAWLEASTCMLYAEKEGYNKEECTLVSEEGTPPVCAESPAYASLELVSDGLVFNEALGNGRFSPFRREEVAEKWIDVLGSFYISDQDRKPHACAVIVSAAYALDRIHVPQSENVLQTAVRIANVLSVALGYSGKNSLAKAFAIAAKFFEYIAYIKAQVVIKKTMRYTEAKQRQDAFITYTEQLFGYEDWEGVLRMAPFEIDNRIVSILLRSLSRNLKK